MTGGIERLTTVKAENAAGPTVSNLQEPKGESRGKRAEKKIEGREGRKL